MNSSQSDHELRRALDQFASLLHTPATLERDWQQLFTDHPYILSRTLPLRVSPSQIRPLARPGVSEPDFVILPDLAPTSPRGIIEIKTPHAQVFTFPRKELITLSRDAATAVQQTNVYADEFAWPDRVVVIGDSVFKFVIMGMSKTWADHFQRDIIRNRARNLLPPGIQIYGFDQIFSSYHTSVPHRVILLSPASALITNQAAIALRLRELTEKLQGTEDSSQIREITREIADTDRDMGNRALSLFAQDEHGERWHVALLRIFESQPWSSSDIDALAAFVGSRRDRSLESHVISRFLNLGVIDKIGDPMAAASASRLICRAFDGYEHCLYPCIAGLNWLLSRIEGIPGAKPTDLCRDSMDLIASIERAPESAREPLERLQDRIRTLSWPDAHS